MKLERKMLLLMLLRLNTKHQVRFISHGVLWRPLATWRFQFSMTNGKCLRRFPVLLLVPELSFHIHELQNSQTSILLHSCALNLRPNRPRNHGGHARAQHLRFSHR